MCINIQQCLIETIKQADDRISNELFDIKVMFSEQFPLDVIFKEFKRHRPKKVYTSYCDLWFEKTEENRIKRLEILSNVIQSLRVRRNQLRKKLQQSA